MKDGAGKYRHAETKGDITASIAGKAPIARPTGTATAQAIAKAPRTRSTEINTSPAKPCSANKVKIVCSTCSGGGTKIALTQPMRVASTQRPKNATQIPTDDTTDCRRDTGTRTRSRPLLDLVPVAAITYPQQWQPPPNRGRPDQFAEKDCR